MSAAKARRAPKPALRKGITRWERSIARTVPNGLYLAEGLHDLAQLNDLSGDWFTMRLSEILSALAEIVWTVARERSARAPSRPRVGKRDVAKAKR